MSERDSITIPTLKLASRLLLNALRFQYLRWNGRPGKPLAISLEITHNCIAKCIMCNIWKISSKVPDLSMDDWLGFLSDDLLSDLRELDITGGEPFIRSDLPDFFSGVCELKRKNLRNLRSIAVTTNGFLTDRVLECVEKALPMLKKHHIDLVMVCAMDAIGEIHEKIRNYPNAWSKVDETIRGLNGLKEKYSNLVVGLKTTVLPLNVGQLKEIVDYAKVNDLFTIISPCIITDARYLNPEKAHDLVFSQEDIQKMVTFYESEAFRWSYHADTIMQVLKKNIPKKPCSCGFNYFFVRSTGQLFLCPLINMSIGNIKETSLKHLLNSKKASDFRKTIGKFPECQRCTEPGLERYALPYEGLTYLSLLFKMGPHDFFQLHRHMGLDKYFS